MWPRFGIKIGNSTLCIAHVKADGKPEVIANKQGDRTSQACLLWNGDDDIECGLTAKQKMATRPKQAVANSFQLLVPPGDITEEQLTSARKEIPCAYDAETHMFQLECNVPGGGDQGDDDNAATHQLSAFNVQVQLLRAELELARQYLNNSEEEKPIVVMSIPSYYSVASRSLLAQAAEEAGFHVSQIISEPTAAVLAYGIGEDVANVATSPTDETTYVLTIKCGGLFSHFAVYSVRDGLYTQMDAHGPFPIGGRQYTEALVQFICVEFQRKYKLDPHESRRSLAKIRVAASNCKYILTQLPATQLYIDSLMDGIDFNSQMTRARFESLIQPVINNFMQTLGECVDRSMQAHPEIKKFDEIVLLGATMQIPKLQSAIGSRFPEAQLRATISADEVVAIGCARQTTFVFDPKGQDIHATENCLCAEEQLLIWHGDDESNAQVLLEKGALLPSTVRLDIKKKPSNEKSTADNNSTVVHLRSGDKVIDAMITGVTTTDPSTESAAEGEGEADVLRIEADISCKEDNNKFTPVVRLRSIV